MSTIASFHKTLAASVSNILECTEVGEVFFNVQKLFYSDLFQELLENSENDPDKRKEIFGLVRKEFEPCYERGGLLQHSITKPYGYSGDYEILEHLYDKSIHPKTHPSYRAFDEYVHQLNLIQAVCQRKDILSQLLNELADSKKRYCSIACGSAREVWESRKALEGSFVTLLDFDPRALDFATSRLEGSSIQVEAKVQDGRRLNLGDDYDVIYSFGFFDYLKNRFVDSIIKKAKECLKPDGRIIYSFKNNQNYEAWFYDMLCDWRFEPRNKADADLVASRNGLIIEHCIPTENHAAYVYVCRKA